MGISRTDFNMIVELVGGGWDSRPVFLQVLKPFAGFVQVLFGWGGSEGHSYCVHAQNTGICSAFASL